MSTAITMPQLGESVTEGTVGRWLKRPGDVVAKYEPLLEVITDKVDSEVPAPVAGTLLEILVAEGETVRVGTLIARIGLADEASPPAEAAPAEPAASAPQPPPSAAATPAAEARKSYLSPVVARLIAEHGLDLRQIVGTGLGGRVSKQDVLRFLEQPQEDKGAKGQGDKGTSTLDALPLSNTQHPTPNTQHPPLDEDVELLPLSPMRRAIAEHMTRSVRTSPHVTTVMEVDLSRVMAHREANKAAFAQQGVRLTLTAYFFQATAVALSQVPVLNGSFSEQGIVLNRRVHIGMAVALDEGLLVPVLRDADERNLLGLARTVNDLAERARARRLKPDETQGGTFTITNHGVSGSLFATPIINQPQAGILGVGAIVKRPVVVSSGDGDAIAIRPICYLSLTFDHRIADGSTADAFLGAIKQRLEEYS
jgi:2-oxoisovalerate dehydrogenase E2 component (dihydrolipoyl transacylase)